MIFQKALEHLKNGKKIRRRGWYTEKTYVIYSNQEQAMFVKNWNDIRGLDYTFSIDKSIDGLIVPWLSNYTDLYSDDWEIVF